MAVAILTGSEIEAKVLETPGLVAVDFYQSSCPPCRALEPRLGRVAQAYAGRVAVYASTSIGICPWPSASAY